MAIEEARPRPGGRRAPGRPPDAGTLGRRIEKGAHLGFDFAQGPIV